ncbi:MAG: pyridoxal phosphate-dependent aminotransferase [Synergistaceae bacterium]|jgi:histidinol-phosphate aminotransferase|nr:pyridoxal phosphate-dependent aminotransferase [Synergistaceae bacterium]
MTPKREKALNWEKDWPDWVREPQFQDYGGEPETRPVKVNCSLGVNPLNNIFGIDRLTIDISKTYRYPHNPEALAERIRARWPLIGPVNLSWGAGSMGIISNLAHILSGRNVKVLGVTPQFMPALREFALAGARVSTVRLSPGRFALGARALADALEEDTTVLYLDNPNNPTGSALSLKDVEFLAKECASRGTLLIADEAYADFLDDAESAFNLDMDNIICMRTLSKGCGLAGLRIGYAVIRNPELRRACEERALSYAVSDIAAAAAAELLPRIDFGAMRKRVQALKSRVVEFIAGYGAFAIADTHPAVPIFLLTWKGEGSKEEDDLFEKLMEAGICAESGRFFELGAGSVRMRVPPENQFEEFCALWRGLFG